MFNSICLLEVTYENVQAFTNRVCSYAAEPHKLVNKENDWIM